jgi:hypothetical protein
MYPLIELRDRRLFSCMVRMWDGEYAVGLKHLKSYDYLPAECEQDFGQKEVQIRICWNDNTRTAFPFSHSVKSKVEFTLDKQFCRYFFQFNYFQ